MVLRVKNTVFFFILVFIASSLKVDAQFIGPGGRVNLDQQDVPVDIVRGIRALASSANRNSIKISWVPSEIDGGTLIVARSRTPITNRDLLLSADEVAKLPPGETFHIDRGLQPGNYYYAVANVDQISSGKIKMYAGENYTTQPITVRRREVVVEDSPRNSYRVSLIFAQLMNNRDVKVSWRGVTDGGVIYNVYRSQEPINSNQRLRRAKLLDKVTGGAEYYTDNNLPGPGIYYYAVTVTIGGSENKNLIANQSYTTGGVRFATVDLPITRYIRVSIQSPGEVLVEWRDISNSRAQEYNYDLYRSNAPIRSDADLSRAQKLRQIRSGVETYLDRGLQSATYYYALVTRNTYGQSSNRYLDRQNTASIVLGRGNTTVSNTNVDLTVTRRVNEFAGVQIFSDFAAFERRNLILLSWKSALVVHENNLVKIHIYRFKKRPSKISDLVNGTLIAKLSNEQQLFEEVPPEDGVYYYGLFLETRFGLKPEFFEKQKNFIGPINFKQVRKGEERREPVVDTTRKKKKKKQPTASDINRVLRQTYLKGRFSKAIASLAAYTQSSSRPVKAKALFYTGLSNYRMGQYDTALEYFVDPLVVRAYGSRARFWYKRTLEKLK